MAEKLTRDFRDTVRQRMQHDKEFHADVLASMITQLLDGQLDLARYQLREYIIGDVGLEQFSQEIEIPAKSLSRMLGPKGNPTSDNLIKIITSVSKRRNIKLRAIAEPV
jgi:DNA-binding phage protein